LAALRAAGERRPRGPRSRTHARKLFRRPEWAFASPSRAWIWLGGRKTLDQVFGGSNPLPSSQRVRESLGTLSEVLRVGTSPKCNSSRASLWPLAPPQPRTQRAASLEVVRHHFTISHWTRGFRLAGSNDVRGLAPSLKRT
jgi:hypothetical protein